MFWKGHSVFQLRASTVTRTLVPFFQVLCRPLVHRKPQSSYFLISILGGDSKRDLDLLLRGLMESGVFILLIVLEQVKYGH